MQKTCDLSADATVFVVDVGIEEAGLPMERNDIIVGNGGRDKGAVTFAEQNLVASGTYTYMAVTFDAHADDETVIFDEVAMERCGHLCDAHTEER